MPFLGNLNKNKTLYEAAIVYLRQNLSIIPVSSNKRSIIKWKAYQQQQPTLAQLQQWFNIDSHGIGIITGKISQLAVLDFDNSEQFQKFIHEFPALTQTYTIKTRRGWHFYYQILENIHTRSLKGQGIDWQWEGRYVVAPPTPGYEIALDKPILTLSQEDISAIEAFVQPTQAAISDIQTQHITKEELLGHYTKHAQLGQRNDSLFKTGLLARDYGWSLEETIKLLSSYHAHNRHHQENIEQRQREVVATLNSVFSRPARPQRKQLTLPNLIREKLFQMGLTSSVRVWESLHQFDYTPGMYISHDEAWTILAGIVGKHSIRKAFTATNEAGLPLFEVVESHENPSPRTPTHEASAILTPKGITKNAFVRLKKPEEMKTQGRKGKYYRIPNIVELARLLDVRVGSIRDELCLDDLKAAKLTRQAAHRNFIKRRPGKYSSKWLAQRLGVSIITKNRYDKEIAGLYKKATYTVKAIYTRTLYEIPDDLDVPGMFLEDNTGKRWPAKQVIAAKLLKQGRRVKLMRQGVNYYWVGGRFDYEMQQLYFTPPKVRNSSENWRKNAEAYWQQEPLGTAIASHRHVQHAISSDLSDTRTLAKKKPKISTIQQQNPKRAFRETWREDRAKSIQKRINKLTQVAKQQISLGTVRKLMMDYGHKEILKVIKRIEWRNNVENPVGLLIVILRSEKRVRERQFIS